MPATGQRIVVLGREYRIGARLAVDAWELSGASGRSLLQARTSHAVGPETLEADGLRVEALPAAVPAELPESPTELRKARRALKRADDALSAWALGRVELRLGSVLAAVKAYRRAAALEPLVPRLWCELVAASKCASSTIAAGLDALYVFRATFPRSARCDAAGVDLLLAAGRPQEAADLLGPRAAGPQLERVARAIEAQRTCRALLAAKRVDEARAAYPADPLATLNLGLLRAAQGQLGEAAQLLATAAPLLPRRLETLARANVAFCLMRAGEADLGLTVLEKSVPASASPGIALWADDEQVTQDLPRTAELLERAVAQAGAGPIRIALLQRYREAAREDT